MGPYPWIVSEAVIMRASPAQTITLPYSFEALPILSSTHTLPLPDFTETSFVNNIGSYALTVFSLVDSLNVLGILIVLLLAIGFIWWIYKVVTASPEAEVFNLTGATNALTETTGDETYRNVGQAVKKSKKLWGKNPYR